MKCGGVTVRDEPIRFQAADVVVRIVYNPNDKKYYLLRPDLDKPGKRKKESFGSMEDVIRRMVAVWKLADGGE